jgi:hypothetical protein
MLKHLEDVAHILKEIKEQGREVVTLEQLVSEGLTQELISYVKDMENQFVNATMILDRNPETPNLFGFNFVFKRGKK